MTPISSVTPWLVEMTTGEYVCKRPLKRCSAFTKLPSGVKKGAAPSTEGTPHDPMKGVAYGDEEDQQFSTLSEE